MRTRTKWLACLLLGGLFTPATVRAQNLPSPSWEFPLPLMWGQKESGFYFVTEGLFWRLNNPLRDQPLALRGFVDIDGQAAGISGDFIGPGTIALNVTDVGTGKYEPGVRFNLGYRFENSWAIEASYWRMSEFRHTAGAGIMPRNFNVGTDFSGSFLFSPFFNFSSHFAGPIRDIVSAILPPDILIDPDDGSVIVGVDPDDVFHGGKVIPAFGIWNAADDMTLDFKQEAQNLEIIVRVPVVQTECGRAYLLCGPRYLKVDETFKWRTVDLDVDGLGLDPADQATYVNEWTNRFIGVQAGMGSECYLGGGFAVSFELRGGLFADLRDTNIKIERGDEAVAVQRHRNDAYYSPMVQGGAYIWWFPIEGVQIRAGYEFLGVWNAHRSPAPVDWDVGHLDPHFENMFMRFDGINLGIALIF